MGQSSDTEITLGTGKLLALFFGLVVVCAIFFSLGYALGKNSGGRGTSLVSDGDSANPNGGAKPTAGTPGQQAKNEGPNELTFYKSVEQKDADPKLAQPQPDANQPKDDSGQKAPEMKTAPVGTGYLVQVAAVSKQQDAEALVDALHKKQYPAFIADGGDKLFHVQVGPFASLNDAETMKTRLTNDGYNPMVKR